MENELPSQTEHSSLLKDLDAETVAGFILHAYVLPGITKFNDMLKAFMKGGGTAEDIADLVRVQAESGGADLMASVDGSDVPMPAISISRSKRRAESKGTSFADMAVAHRDAIKSLAASSPSWELVHVLLDNNDKEYNYGNNDFIDDIFSRIRNVRYNNNDNEDDSLKPIADHDSDASIEGGPRMDIDDSQPDSESDDAQHHQLDDAGSELHHEGGSTDGGDDANGGPESSRGSEEASGLQHLQDGSDLLSNQSKEDGTESDGLIDVEVPEDNQGDGRDKEENARATEGSNRVDASAELSPDHSAQSTLEADVADDDEEADEQEKTKGAFAAIGFEEKLEPNHDEPMLSRQEEDDNDTSDTEADATDDVITSLMHLGYSREQAEEVIAKSRGRSQVKKKMYS